MNENKPLPAAAVSRPPCKTAKDINRSKAESYGRRFARDQKMAYDDPIVKTLVTGLKMVFGRRTALNKRQAEDALRQPSLFQAEMKNPIYFESAKSSQGEPDGTPPQANPEISEFRIQEGKQDA